MRYHVLTLGCPKNVADSERLERLLAEGGHRPVRALKDADVIIVNTCSFIDDAKEESINAVLRLAMRKQPHQKLLVAGCLPEIHGRELRHEIGEIDHLFGVEAWDKIVDFFARSQQRPTRPPVPSTDKTAPRVSAYLKIADGCNARCSFCVIPRIKGRLHSTPLPILVADAARLVDEGARELTLIAQDTTMYGRDLGMRDGLATLLEALAEKLPPSVWLRVMYAYPGHVSLRLVGAMASLPQVCHYLDIPLQHAVPDVLRRMRRPHDIDSVRRTISSLRAAMPDIALRTTFLVGFPGETDSHFRVLLDYIRETRFDHVGAFIFSPQQGTAAAGLPDQVPERVKRRRYRELMQLAREISLEENHRWIGRELTVLVESQPGRTGNLQTLRAGRSFRDAPEIDGLVLFEGDAAPGDLKRVRVTQAMTYDLLATLMP